MKKIFIFLLLIPFFFSLPTSAQENSSQFFEGKIVIKLKEGVGEFSRQENLVSFGVSSLDEKVQRFQVHTLEKRFRHNAAMRNVNLPDLSRIYTLTFPQAIDVNSVIKSFDGDPNVEYAEPIPINFMYDVPNDNRYDECQHLPQIMAEQAWDVHKGEDGDNEVIIGVIDSGVDWDHPDLIDNIWQNLGEDIDGDGAVLILSGDEWIFDPDDENGVDDDGNGFVDDFIGWDFINSDNGQDNNPTPEGSDHGTHCAGISAGVTNNEIGISSITWNVTILPTKHDKDGGNAYESNPFDGIIYAAENGADVISTSWGTMFYSRANEEALAYAAGLGSIIVSSAGNEDWDLPGYPSAFPHVISVASVASNDEKAYYSSYGMSVDISAPGGDTYVDGGILSTVDGGGYDRFQGTSMAAPLAAGLLGLMKSYYPDWTNEQIIAQFLGTADNIDEENPDYIDLLGSGRINAYRALTEENVSIPQELRIKLSRATPNQALEPGETVDISITLRNYAHLIASENVTLTLSTADPEIQILNDSHQGSIVADGYSTYENAFQIQVDEEATFHDAEFTLTLDADIPIIFGDTIAFDLPIMPSGGVLVWEHTDGGWDMSGTYIHDFLLDSGVMVSYASGFNFPASMLGFDAVFLSYGNLSQYPYFDNPPNFDTHASDVVEEYLAQAGKFYIEGNDVMYYQADSSWALYNEDLLSSMGISAVEDGSSNPLDNLQGQDGSLAEGLSFNSSSQANISSIDKFFVNEAGTPVFVESDYGVTAVQNDGDSGEKTVCSSYALSYLDDGEFPNMRDQLLARILTFFDIDFAHPDFSADMITGHAPLTVQFTDYSSANPEIISYAWDFDSDGNTDSYDQHPTWTYEASGIYAVTLEITTSEMSNALTRQAYINVFDGKSAIAYDGTESYSVCPADPSLNVTDAITVEAWITPHGWGEIDGVGFGRIIDKNKFSLYLVEESPAFNSHSLVFQIMNDSGPPRNSNTPENSIALDEWQHVAATYDGESVVKIYINGEEQSLNQTMPPSGNIADNSTYDLVIGNAANQNFTFDGGIDQLRLWNYARTSAEIASTMEHYLYGNEAGLVGYWTFDEGNGSEFSDLTENANNGTTHHSQWIWGAELQPSSISTDGIATPEKFRLYNNFPNPFNPTTTIRFEIPKTVEVNLQIYDITGKLVKTLVDAEIESGYHSVVWDGTDENGQAMASGLYFYQIEGKQFNQTKQCLLLK